jgi:hypothetical protein
MLRRRMPAATAILLALVTPPLFLACRAKPSPAPRAAGQPPAAVQERISGGPYPAIVLAQAWFWKDVQGKQRPGPARLQIWRDTPTGWQASRLEDADSNVFHKAIQRDGSLITIGAEKAMLKRWTLAGGEWKGEMLWTREWGGKFNRLRDIEIGDVNGDGRDEYVIATHDSGVVAVYSPASGSTPSRVVELDQQPDTFVHEIEIGDIDGDGIPEFFATPSGRNRLGVSQSGQIVMHKWDGQGYPRTVVDPLGTTHAKEILATDIDGDGRAELFGAIEAQLDSQGRIVRPVEIRQYWQGKSGAFRHEVIATIPDAQCRFLVAADFDGDGQQEIVAAPIKTGLYLLHRVLDKKTNRATWSVTQFETQSSGFEHACVTADLDGDGRPELYVAADDQRELVRYDYDRAAGTFRRTRLGALEPGVITWNVTAGRL